MFRALSKSNLQTVKFESNNTSHANNSSPSAGKPLGPLATKLKNIRQNSHTNLQNELQKSLPPRKFQEVTELINNIESNEPDFEQVHTRINSFIQANKNNPEMIENTLKYLNSQLMILSGAERHFRAEEIPVKESLTRGLNSLMASGQNTVESLVQSLASTKVSPVFTAHPTNFNKPEASQIVLSQLGDIATPEGNAKICHELWQVQGVREAKPTVQEEAKQFSSNIRHLHSSSRTIHKRINSHLAGLPDNLTLKKPLIEAGNWVGGDRDGNPNIDAKVLQDVVKTFSEAAFDHFEQKLFKVKNRQPGSLCNLLSKAGNEVKLNGFHEKLSRTKEHLIGDGALPIRGDLYLNAHELLQDIEGLDISQLDDSEQTVVSKKLNLLELEAESIGFHGASTDIRQNSSMNEKSVGELMRRSGGAANYEQLDESEKQNVLTDLLTNKIKLDWTNAPLVNQLGNSEFDREIALIKSYKIIHDSYGPQALKNCITANTETMSDMLEVMVLLKFAGLADENNLKMNVVPLIETVDDLHNGPNILKNMLTHPWYSKALQSSGGLQQIMMGYSDSNRLDGPLSSNWAVYECTAKMLDVAKQYGVELHIFHGRGGTEARGSGDSYAQEISSTNGASLLTGMRQTEQGEEVTAKFGTKNMSQSNLAEMVGTTLETMAGGKDQLLQKYANTMEQLAKHARASYASLYTNPELPTYFQKSTPIVFVGKSNAGSRPASRATTAEGGLNLDKLRAIPWVGAWYQSGTAMPAFFGTGTALKSYVADSVNTNSTPVQRRTELKKMYQEWPFFKTFIDRTASAMEKADMQIAQEYAKLAPPQSQQVFEVIKEEFELTKEMIQSIKQSSELMSHSPEVSETLEVKKSLTHAAHAMQIGLLKAHQEMGPNFKDQLEKPIVMSMQAIASANRFG